MFKRHDCPHLHKSSNWCGLEATKIINRTDITYKQKYERLHKMSCSGCEIYKQIKKNHC